jgi:putative ABC transport system permease protein
MRAAKPGLRHILAALSRDKRGPALLVFEIALTLAIVCNLLFIVELQQRESGRQSGIDEAAIASFHNELLSVQDDQDARVRADLKVLRSMPGVVDAFASNAIPLGDGYMSGVGVGLSGELTSAVVTSAYYEVDEHALKTFNLHLVEGRWFSADEIEEAHAGRRGAPVAVITSSLAKDLFAEGSAVGKSVYLNQQRSRVIGVVQRLQAWVQAEDAGIERSVMVPRLVGSPEYLYILRLSPRSAESVLSDAQNGLFDLDRRRVIDRVETFATTRASAYRANFILSVIVGCIGVLLLFVTAVGLVGLTSYWVTQRGRQIGIRRALGARRSDILALFHAENLIVTCMGAVLGTALALGANIALVSLFETARLPLWFVVATGFAILCLGQLSVIWPALRAANIAPAIAAKAP